MMDAVVLADDGHRYEKSINPYTLQINGISILQHTITTLQEVGFSKIIIVLGADHRLILNDLYTYQLDYIYNAAYRQSDLNSIKAAISMLSAEADSFLVCRGDGAMLSAKHIEEIIQAYDNRQAGKQIVCPSYKDRIGFPMICSASAQTALLEAPGITRDTFLHRNNSIVENIELGIIEYFYTLDTPKDYTRLCRYLEVKEEPTT